MVNYRLKWEIYKALLQYFTVPESKKVLIRKQTPHDVGLSEAGVN